MREHLWRTYHEEVLDQFRFARFLKRLPVTIIPEERAKIEGKMAKALDPEGHILPYLTAQRKEFDVSLQNALKQCKCHVSTSLLTIYNK